jgi:hypothetical protein
MALRPDGLTNAIETAFATEWAARKGGSPPEAGKQDRQLMFAAVARGVLEYLAGTTEIISHLTVNVSGGSAVEYDVTKTQMNIEL